MLELALELPLPFEVELPLELGLAAVVPPSGNTYTISGASRAERPPQAKSETTESDNA